MIIYHINVYIILYIYPEVQHFRPIVSKSIQPLKNIKEKKVIPFLVSSSPS